MAKKASPIRVTVWNEFRHEQRNETVKSVYPQGMHVAIADGLRDQLGDAVVVRTATLDEPDHGLTDEVLAETDVLTWWGHGAHEEVRDDIVLRVHEAVMCGMGFIGLHSTHWSKVFKKLMGTICAIKWREAAEMERLWVVSPGHPITNGIGEYIELEHTEMYGELFDIPEPDELVFISWFEGGEVFRSGCCWRRGKGQIFYFRPGHETFPIYYNPEIQRVIANAVQYVARREGSPYEIFGAGEIKVPLSPIRSEHTVDQSIH